MEGIRRVWYLLNRNRREAELAEEMTAHCEMMEHGGSRSFGNELRLREDAREVWGWTWLDRGKT